MRVVAESYESLEKKGKDKDVKTVLQPNATIGVIIGLICLTMPFRETSKTRKEQEAYGEETFVLGVDNKLCR